MGGKRGKGWEERGGKDGRKEGERMGGKRGKGWEERGGGKGSEERSGGKR
jgi:hypothetical protein